VAEPVAIGVFEGPDLRVVKINEELARLTGCSDITGLPAREVWFGPAARRTQALMRATLLDGVARRDPSVVASDGRTGTVFIEPLMREGRVWAVATAWEPTPLRPRSPVAGGDHPRSTHLRSRLRSRA
jgi:hypothetical protein